MTQAADTASTNRRLASMEVSEAVRKQVTVLFCDIANYTERAASMDPEDLSEDIREFQDICSNIAESYQGHVSNYLGDGIMVLFGHPHASEFSPECAVRAGLEMVNAIKTNNLNPNWKTKNPLAIRIGIATGLVVVGDRAGNKRDQDELIFGTAPNLAARLQNIAEPNTVVVALRTRRLVGLTFKFKELGQFNLKGFNKPISAWQILYARKQLQRPGNILKRNTSPFLSRKKELLMLERDFKTVRYGFSRFIHIIGEPGIGKTRLIRRFDRSISAPEIHRMRITCSPYYQNSFLKPVIDECYRWLQISQDDDLATKQASVGWAMSIVKLNQNDRHLLFTEFMGIAPPTELDVMEMSPEAKRMRTIDVLATVIMAVSKNRPVLLVAEDLHWADPSTLELLRVLMHRSSEQRILGIFTSRPEFDPPWKKQDHLTTTYVTGLTQVESRKLVESVFENHFLPESLKQTLVHKCDGVPLYLEESCFSAINHMRKNSSNDPLLHGYDLPETLQDSLNARLELLGDTKTLAQLASTFGDNFPYQAINKIASLNGIDADNGMDTLIDENILILDNETIEDRFKFRHVMFQEAAYQSLLKKTRQQYHHQIADLLLARDPNIADKTPELVAYHFSKTDQTSRAIDLWIKAGKTAIEKSAIIESIDHLQQGLALLDKLEAAQEPHKRELELLLNLGVALTARAGYYGYEVTRTYERAVDLAQEVGNDRQEWTALYGLWRCLISQAEYAKALRIATTLAKLCSKLKQPILDLTSFGIKAMTRFVDGKLIRADSLTDQAVAIYDIVEDKQVGQKFGQDPFVTIQGLGAVAKLLRGRISESVVAINRSLAVARQIDHPYTIAETLKLASMYEQISRNTDKLKKHCTEAIEISNQYGFEGILSTSQLFLAFADLARDKDQSQIDIIRENLIQYEQDYGLLFLPYFQGILAEAYLMTEQYTEAFETAEAILQDINHSGENWVKAMTLCLKSSAAIRGGLVEPSESRKWYLEALDVAVKQDARLILGRILDEKNCFKLSPELTNQYQHIADSAESALLANHAYITTRH